jgi:iron-sulfur cluster insertion protein
MITLTDLAKSKIIELSEAEGIGHCNVRLKIIGSGCAGFSYDMFYEDQPSEGDEVFNFDNVKIIIDQLSFSYLDGTEIDYSDTPFKAGFSFKNPNVSGSCGCGNSFSF